MGSHHNIRMKVILQVVFFIFFVALTRPSRASEALVMVGGDYLPGFLDNEVEVWSPSNTCDLEVLPTPDYFNGVPGAALLEIRSLFVVDRTFMDNLVTFVIFTIYLRLGGEKVLLWLQSFQGSKWQQLEKH